MFCETFKHLPLCSVVNNSVFVVHGGLFHSPSVVLSDIENIDRFDYKAEKANPNTKRNKKDPTGFYLRTLQQCMLWSDPVMSDKVVANDARGAGVLFGPSITEAFLAKNKLNFVVRSHECMQDGIGWPFEGTSVSDKLCTLFSSSNYHPGVPNNAAFLVLYCHDVPGAEQVPDSNIFHITHSFSTSKKNGTMTRQSSKQLMTDLIIRKWNTLRLQFSAADISGSGVISSTVWADIMRDVTKLSILFLPLIPLLAPSHAVLGPHIDYRAFLKEYELGFAKKIEIHQLYEHKRALEGIFQYFDTNGDGAISQEEFRAGFDCINKNLPPEKRLEKPDEILKIMDFDKSMSIDKNEFFEV